MINEVPKYGSDEEELRTFVRVIRSNVKHYREQHPEDVAIFVAAPVDAWEHLCETLERMAGPLQ